MKFHFWYATLSVFYLALAYVLYTWLAASGKLATFVPLGDFVLIALATQRLVRLFAYDSITGFIRSWFDEAAPDSFAHTCGSLIGCPWCLGLWFALVVVFAYFATPVAWYAILVLALSSVAAYLQLLANWLGWSAEEKKRAVNLSGFSGPHP